MATGYQYRAPRDAGRRFVCLYSLNKHYRDASLLESYCYSEHKHVCWEVEASWSAKYGHIEVERCNGVVRPFDNSKSLSLCRYYRNCTRKGGCTRAHSINELDKWNFLFKSSTPPQQVVSRLVH